MQPPYSRTLFELLDEQAGHRPGAPAVIDAAATLSWSALTERARRAASVLAARGVTRGDRVGLLLNNRTEWLEIAFGTWLLGATLTPFSTWSTRRELAFLLEDSAIRVLVALPHFGREDYATMLRELAPQRNLAVLLTDGGAGFPDYATARDSAPRAPTPPPGEGASASDDAIILYSSGSTSTPKAIALAHYLVVENGFNIGECQGLGPDDRVLLAPPLFWAYGGINALPAAFGHGATLVLQSRFEPGEALDLIDQHRCTSIYTLPGMTDALIRHPAFDRPRTGSLRTGLTIGSPQDVIRAAEALGASEICNIYGASEVGGNCCVTQHDWPLERRANCQGFPLPGVRLRIADETTGTILGPSKAGQVEIAGPYVMRGYVNASAKHNAGAFTRDGWFRTGDIGQLNHDGTFVFLGRSTEMIKRAGINVSPAEVEDVLMQHPAVAHVGVVGAASSGGESIIAFVVLRGDARPDAKALEAHCRALASGYKIPDRFEIVDALPTTVTGKLMRRELKDAAARLVGGG